MLGDEFYDDQEARPAPAGGVTAGGRMRLILILVALIVPVLLLLRPPPRHPAVVLERGSTNAVVSSDVLPTAVLQATLSPLFTPEVQYWGAKIVAWAAAYGLPPNMVATVMQIESCGNPAAVSPAGAQGLFQVMPFHFEPGETMQDPDTNARRGMEFLAGLLVQTGGDPGRAFAGYNGGPGAASSSWDTWPAETQRYYTWSSGIYEEVTAGSSSPTLDAWLAAGGAALCRQAAAQLGLPATP